MGIEILPESAGKKRPVRGWSEAMKSSPSILNRRRFLSAGAMSFAGGLAATSGVLRAEDAAAVASDPIVLPPVGRPILLSCKLTMIAREQDGKALTLTERLKLAGEAGFDGVDLDEAGSISAADAREAVKKSGVFVHNAINHAHWQKRLTSPEEADRTTARANIEHCIRVSHAAGGNGVLIVVGQGGDGSVEEIEDRSRRELHALIPLAASLGQPILIENVWNRMFYDHDGKPEQGAERFVRFVDSFNSPWIGMYYDVGNHWKYGQPGEWIRAFGRRCVKLDVKGFSRAKDRFVDITSEDDDLPWDQVRKALKDIGFTGWATAEVGGGGLRRLVQVREQMERAFGYSA